MNRREALSRVALILGGTVVGSSIFLEGCKPGEKKAEGVLFINDDIAFLDEVAETIIPETDTPGAKAAAVGAFMTVMVTDCYTPEDQKVFVEGIKKLQAASKEKLSKDFLQATPEERHTLLTAIDEEAKAYTKNKKPEDPKHYFRMMKELTLLGFFTSEPGATKTLRYIAVPGKYDGCLPYNKGDRAWAT